MVISVVIVPVLGWLTNIPFLAPCLDPYVRNAVLLLSLAIALGLIACASTAPEPEPPRHNIAG